MRYECVISSGHLARCFNTVYITRVEFHRGFERKSRKISLLLCPVNIVNDEDTINRRPDCEITRRKSIGKLLPLQPLTS